MKRWKKGLALLSLLAAGGVMWTFSGTQAEAAEKFPVISITLPENESDGVKVTSDNVTYIPATLKSDTAAKSVSQEELSDKNQLPDTLSVEVIKNYIENGNYITAGNIKVNVLGTFEERAALVDSYVNYEDSSAYDASDTVDGVNEQTAKIKVQAANSDEIIWVPLEYIPTSGVPTKGNAYQFAVYDDGVNRGYFSGLWLLMKYQQKQYLVHYTTELVSEDFLTYQNIPNKTVGYMGGSYGPPSGTSRYFGLKDEENLVFTAKNYNLQFQGTKGTKQVNFKLGLGASIVEGSYGSDVKCTINGATVMFSKSTNLCWEDEPLKFTVKNAHGAMKTYTFKTDMVWELNAAVVKNSIKAIWVDGVLTAMPGTGKINIRNGAEVKIQVNTEAGKKLSGFTATSYTNSNYTSGKAKIEPVYDVDTMTFTMPRTGFKPTAFAYEDYVTSKSAVTTKVKCKEKDETLVDLTGVASVIVKDSAGNPVSEAGAGEQLTIKAESPLDENSYYEYQFDHWEAENITISKEDQTKQQFTISMPNSDITLTAVFVKKGVEVTLGVQSPKPAASLIRFRMADRFIKGVEDEEVTDTYRTSVQYEYEGYIGKPESYRFVGWLKEDGSFWKEENTDIVTWKKGVQGINYPTVTLREGMTPLTFIFKVEAKKPASITYTVNDDSMGTVTASYKDAPLESGTIRYDGDNISLKAKAKKGYIFDTWKADPAASIEFADASKEETTCTITENTATQVTIQAVFKRDPSYEHDDCVLSKVELLNKDGKVIKQANKKGTEYTIKLTAADMSAEEAGKLTDSNYLLRLIYPETAKAKMENGFGDGENGKDRWLTGISNGIGKGGKATFVITAENGNQNTYTVAIVYDERPVLTAGAVNRLSNEKATVAFRSSSKGMYYYQVVDAGEKQPNMSTDSVGITIKVADRDNTITLENLTEGAKDIYIIVKNDEKSNKVMLSDVLKINIPAYDPSKTGYTIGINQAPGGIISVDKDVAKEGELVTVTVTPDTGKQIKPDGLRYSQSGPPYEVVKIDTKTKQFKMPAYDISVSCTFVNADTVTTDGPAISAFIVNGVSGSINDTTGTITVTLPYGTDLTALKPAITLKGAVSVSPVSGEKVDLSSSKTYTVTAEDGTTKTYTVTAYTEAQPTSDKLWEDMLNHIGGNTGNTGKNTWWQKAKDMKKSNNYPKYW